VTQHELKGFERRGEKREREIKRELRRVKKMHRYEGR
jgi:hypothetical protein